MTMAQRQIREEDARALAGKIAAFADSLSASEREAFEALERGISVLVPVDDVDDEVRQGGVTSRREALWFRLMTRLDLAG